MASPRRGRFSLRIAEASKAPFGFMPGRVEPLGKGSHVAKREQNSRHLGIAVISGWSKFLQVLGNEHWARKVLLHLVRPSRIIIVRLPCQMAQHHSLYSGARG